MPAGFDAEGQTLLLIVGGATVEFTLDKNGRAKTDLGQLQLKLKPSKKNLETGASEFVGGDVQLRARLNKGNWSDDWADEGVNPTGDASNEPMAMDVLVILDGAVYRAQVQMLYNAKAGKNGKFKKPK